MTVSELNLKAKTLLETHFEDIILKGEISKITIHGSGHWYFELKDERSSIACAMFMGNNLKVDFKPSVGDFLELSGNLSLYTQSGRYQFIAKSMQKAGFGDLEAKFLALKDKLEKEGLFNPIHKKSLPKFPLKIGIITSQTSAALQDMLKLIKHKEYFLAKIYIFNALTQGLAAPNSLIEALNKADSMKLDVLILARGGGSREDLFCFNDENLAREIFKVKTPVISAIGHEIDYVISDFVSDFRAPTPSAAIDILLPAKQDLEQGLDILEERFKNVFLGKIMQLEQNLNSLFKLFQSHSLSKIITHKIKQLELLKIQLDLALKNKIQYCELNLNNFHQAFMQHESFFKKSKDLVSIERNGKKIHLNQLKSGDTITLYSQDCKKDATII
ncbi:exodeoxyribonuclease VII large subunit [Campylobacter sp. CCS1377]|uniref:Exodeoxyribonuclease 7 large subunit n=1 Tax=Campylobacter sp. CCS1377 TaxID=3158229 RepID=A0AAU7E8C3_9BACT|nr:exodeoxyribonuclease VII large subunit [Campylobacter jejuni]